MKTIFNKIGLILLALVLTVNITSCKSVQNANNKQKGGAIGAAGGALLGALLVTTLVKVVMENLELLLVVLLAVALVYLLVTKWTNKLNKLKTKFLALKWNV
ncbi:hypothetical protein JCM19300_2878 [Algibacter lectus]|uniref:Uncharacterized protein n=1 Tax=Algibacter lectus TaxID=221126 RepID=A0A090W3M0_9FLAO|nr:hypothetical protein JCM19300_2878 [Algibacter lectus]